MSLPYSNIKAIYGLLGKTGLTAQKNAIVYGFSNGRTESVKELTVHEANELVRYLNQEANKTATQENASANQMRRKILSMCHRMGWETEDGKVDFKVLNEWMTSKSYLKKELNKYSYAELPKLVSQFTEVYKHLVNKV
jgi:hypothetical protein